MVLFSYLVRLCTKIEYIGGERTKKTNKLCEI
jgi:hypothetical protein